MKSLKQSTVEEHETSLSLIEGVKANEAQSWARFVDAFGPLIYYWSRRASLSANDSADIVQEVFRKVFTSIHGFSATEPGATFRGWLWTVTLNTIRDHLRREAEQTIAVGGSDARLLLQQLPASEEADEVSNTCIGDLLGECLEGVRVDCGEQTWSAFTATVFQGRTSAEVASELGITANAVRHAKARVLCRLREYLRTHGVGDEFVK